MIESDSEHRQFAPKTGDAAATFDSGETPPPAVDDSERRFSFEFRGRTGEYFWIWIVNVLLTIATVGIYSPWAKVRTKRYFYGNAFVADANFEYHARPLSILPGRVVVLLLVAVGGAQVAAYGAGVWEIFLPWQLLLLVLEIFLPWLLLLLPWALVRSFSFNARNSSYRGLRFSFARRYGEAYFALFALPTLLLWFVGDAESVTEIVFVAFLPYLVFRYYRFKVANHALGRTRFVFAQSPKPYYFALSAPTFILAAMLLRLDRGASFDGDTFVFLFVLSPLLLFALSVPRAMLFKAFWAGVQTENGARIECDISIIDFAGRILTINFFASLLSFGLLHPWTQVRKARYIAAHLRLVAPPIAIDSLRLGKEDRQFVPKAGDAAATLDSGETPSPAADDSERRFSFEFRGRTGEYFRIWIVNVLLTIATAGIYSPWAKVRTKRYFYGNAFLADANFEYHARPLSILLARAAVLLLVVVGGAVAAAYGADADARYSFLLFLLLPWALVRGFSFNARNSSYRGLRFSFARRYGEAYFVLFALPTLLLALFWSGVERTPPGFAAIGFVGVVVFFMLITFAAFLPYFVFRYYRFKVANHALGRTRFVFAQFPEPYYFALLAPTFILMVMLLLSGGGALFDGDAFIFLFVLSPLLLFALSVPRAMLFKAFWAGVQTENGARIECDISIIGFAGRILTINFFASLLSFGLLHPWTQVRKARYIAAHLRLVAPSAAIDSLRLGKEETIGALGEEWDAVEGFDFDVGLI